MNLVKSGNLNYDPSSPVQMYIFLLFEIWCADLKIIVEVSSK